MVDTHTAITLSMLQKILDHTMKEPIDCPPQVVLRLINGYVILSILDDDNASDDNDDSRVIEDID